MKKKKVVILLSGGLDSATALYLAKSQGYECDCLTFDYGQRHNREIASARNLAKKAGCNWRLIKLDMPWKGSSLTDKSQKIVTKRPLKKILNEIPNTYVPGRNIIFLSMAASLAESIDADKIFIGANSIDFSGYPDCRPAFYRNFQKALDRGTKRGSLGKSIDIEVPLINKTKAQIIKLGKGLNVPHELTWSCYKGLKYPCFICDSCILRQKGFTEAGLNDPLKP